MSKSRCRSSPNADSFTPAFASMFPVRSDWSTSGSSSRRCSASCAPGMAWPRSRTSSARSAIAVASAVWKRSSRTSPSRTPAVSSRSSAISRSVRPANGTSCSGRAPTTCSNAWMNASRPRPAESTRVPSMSQSTRRVMRVACRAVPDAVILVHGGCGNPRDGKVRDEAPYHRALEEALEAGWAALERGGALDGVQAAVESLEDCPLFNAGRGSVLTGDGEVEMDAAVMVGSSMDAGAVAAVTRVRDPVALARLVMEDTGHVLIAGGGAERLAEEHELELCEPAWFVTERQHERWLASQGTVGAVALDASGELAAATSTGGVHEQLPGRIGDSPLIGAGPYADSTCAISATGHGES